MYIVIDTFNNLEEFLSYADRQGSLLAVLSEYYGARVLSFFDRISGLLALMAAIFTVTWFQRTNELTAVTAAGIPKVPHRALAGRGHDHGRRRSQPPIGRSACPGCATS